MKILKKGNPWWVDAIGTCQSCGAEIQLEAEDDPYSQFHPAEREMRKPCVRCPCCRSNIGFPKPGDDPPSAEYFDSIPQD